jgi:hypothetical protein
MLLDPAGATLVRVRIKKNSRMRGCRKERLA